MPQLFAFGFWLSIIIGILFLGLYSRRVATEMRRCPRRCWPPRWRWRANRS
jgi:hypothetical protein